MTSTDMPPSLELSDIMHHISPSPVPLEDHESTAATTTSHQSVIAEERAESPDRHSEAVVLGFRRSEEMGLCALKRRNGSQENTISDRNISITSSRERELLDVVLWLTDPLPTDPTQLERQADTIPDLMAQRDFIVCQVEEERERWQFERESWHRSAEALISQRSKPEKSEETDRLRATYETENKALRDKLQDAQRTLSMLEGDLMRLKPMLLMQPFPTSQRQDKGKGGEMDSRTYLAIIPECHELNSLTNRPYSYSQHPPPRVDSPGPTVATPQPSPQQPQQRSKDRPFKSHGKRNHHNMTPISSDAYTEHLLLAAKRLGRKRAAQVAGIVQHAEREKEVLAQEQEKIRVQKEQETLERERLEQLASGPSGMGYYPPTTDLSHSSLQRAALRSTPLAQPPKTPKRPAIPYPITESPAPPLVFFHQSGPPSATSATNFPGIGVMGTPNQFGAALNLTGGRPSQSSPSTPFNSLLDAARSMLDESDAGGSETTDGRTNGKGRPREHPESPMPKRRKVSGAGKTLGSLDRVKSALDVLADQAAAAVNELDRLDRRVSVDSNFKGKSKANGAEGDQRHNRDGQNYATTPIPRGCVGFNERQEQTKGSSIGATASTQGKQAPAPSPSSRPACQSARKRGRTPDSSATVPPASARGSSRGRPRGTTPKPRSSGSGRVISPDVAEPRVIGTAPVFSPVDEAMASSVPAQPSKDARLENNGSKERAQQHRLSLGVVGPVLDSDTRLGLRPAGLDQNGLLVGGDSRSDSVHVRPALDAPQLSQHVLQFGNSTGSSELKVALPISSETAIVVRGVEDDEDQDAEGEEEEEEGEEDNGEGDNFVWNPPCRSRSPPPDMDDEYDADADAEGEMDFEESNQPP